MFLFLFQVRLAVAGAFHTSFMEPAVSRLEAALTATEIRTPRIPVISNVDAQPHANPEVIKKILARQVGSLLFQFFSVSMPSTYFKEEKGWPLNSSYITGDIPSSVGNNSENSPNQRAPEKL